MFVNKMPRYEILSEEAMATLDRGWRRIVSEIGVEFILPEAVDVFAAAGQRTEDAKVWLDPDFVMEQVAKAPKEFDLRARNPEQTVHVGGDGMAFGSVYGPPFVRDGDVRREATMADFENFCRLSQAFPQLDSAGGTICEPNDRPARLAPPRHGVCAPDADRQALHGLGDVGPERGRHDRDDRDPVRRPHGHRARPRRSSRSSTSTRRFATTTGCSRQCSSTCAPASRSY